MTANRFTEISIRGRRTQVPSAVISGTSVIVTGRLMRVASVHDAEFRDGERALDPDAVGRQLKVAGLTADIFTFSQPFDEHEPRYSYLHEWDNAAVACSADFDKWWMGLPQESRKNVRRAAKRGVSVEVARFDDRLVEGIKGIYDEAPFRQGRRFWHYGKDLATIRAENGSYLQESEFLGAYLGCELIGFMKFVYVGKRAVIMQILAKASHQDKRPMNAMIARAMEICHGKGITCLVYGKYSYGRKKHDAMAEFKRRNGFVEKTFPRYFVPLTLRGRVALALRLHRGVRGLLPGRAIDVMLRVRACCLSVVSVWRARKTPGHASVDMNG